MFINEKYSEEIEKNGYLILNLFSEQDIYSLVEISKSVKLDMGFSGLSYSLMQSDTEKKRKDSEKIRIVIQRCLKNTMENFQVFGESFIIKLANNNEEFYLHQDWNYTDEQKYAECYTLWIPLQDTTIDNGCLFVLPSSHTFFDNYRSATLHTIRIPISETPNLSGLTKPIEMKTGQALLFKQSLFHGSYPNNSESNRWCAVAIIKKKDVPLFYYQKTNENEIARYTIDTDMFVNELKHVSKGNTPTKYTEISIMQYQHPFITEESLVNKATIKIPAIIKDGVINRFFEENGYAQITGISNEILDKANLLYNEYFKDQNKSMFVSHQESGVETNIEVNARLHELFKEWLESVFMDYQFVVGNFISKSNVNSSEFNLHQDWNIVEEAEYPFIHIWIPHQDTTSENGGLKILPRSHKIINNNRSGSLGIPFIDIDSQIQPLVKNLNVQKGNCLLYSPALFHGSSPNKSSKPRIVTLLTITHKDAPLKYFHLNEKGQIEVFLIKSEDLFNNLKLLSLGKIVPYSNNICEIRENTNKISNKDITSSYLASLLKQKL
jgi:ectoine hydroxylase-related dioxygenase (phytanoyl-CoA dioxygenase family)